MSPPVPLQFETQFHSVRRPANLSSLIFPLNLFVYITNGQNLFVFLPFPPLNRNGGPHLSPIGTLFCLLSKLHFDVRILAITDLTSSYDSIKLTIAIALMSGICRFRCFHCFHHTTREIREQLNNSNTCFLFQALTAAGKNGGPMMAFPVSEITQNLKNSVLAGCITTFFCKLLHLQNCDFSADHF